MLNSSPCIDLIFTSQPNTVTESGVVSFLNTNFHLSFQYIYPRPNERGMELQTSKLRIVFYVESLITIGKKLQ